MVKISAVKICTNFWLNTCLTRVGVERGFFLFRVCQMIEASQATCRHVSQTICACVHVHPTCPLSSRVFFPHQTGSANIQLSEINLYMTDRVLRCNYILLLELFLVLLSILVQLRQWWSALGVARQTQNFSIKELEIILKQGEDECCYKLWKCTMQYTCSTNASCTVHAVTLLGPVWSLWTMNI